jgi:uncharacterized membrane protein YedE/YeeE
MSFPVQNTSAQLVLGVLFGAVFGWLLQRGGVTNYNVIVNQFRLKDWTVFRVMFTAIIVGGVGVLALNGLGATVWHIKEANMLGVALGAALFGIGMVVYGYCPGTGVAAVATGSVHALVGFVGMLVGGVLYALTYPWVRDNILTVAAWGKLRLPEWTGVPGLVWFAALAVMAAVVFRWVRRLEMR